VVLIFILLAWIFRNFHVILHIEKNNSDMVSTMVGTGDNVLISPDLTGLTKWTEGIIIEIENNTFNGIVIAAETKDKNVFFGRKDMFKTTNNKELCLQ